MSDALSNESARPSVPSRGIISIPATETLVIAFATAILYMMTSSYQFGYQQAFGFTYISIGVEDITWTIRLFLAPIFFAGFVAVAFSICVRLSKKLRFLPANQLALLIFPPAMLVGLKIFYTLDPLENVSREMMFLMIAYYTVGVGHLTSSFIARENSREFLPSGNTFQAVSIFLLGFMFIILSYDTGRREAYYIDLVEVCDNNSSGASDRIVLQRSADIVICARVDFEKKIVYNDFEYTKLGDGKNFRFHGLSFKPAIINESNPK